MKGRIILLLVLLTIFVVGSCVRQTPTPTPTPTPTFALATAPPTPTDHTNQMPFSLTPVKIDPEPGTTQIHFLVDISGSMEGTCDSLGKENQSFVNFTGGLLKREVEERYQEKILLGIGTFSGDRYESKLPPTSLTKFSNISIKNKPPIRGLTSSTNFTSSIDEAIKDMFSNITNMPATAIDRRYLVILTDGEADDVDKIVKHIKEYIKSKGDNRPIIYIALWCPDKNREKAGEWMIWDDPTSSIFRVFSGPERMLEVLLNSLQPYFPAGARAEVVSSSGTEKLFSGYVTGVSLSYESIIMNNGIDVKIGDAHWSMKPGEFGSYSLPPQQKCPLHRILFTTSSGDGLVFYRPITFKSLQGWIKPGDNPGGNLEVINNNPIKLRIEIADTISYLDLGEWKDCFQISLLDNEHATLLNGMVNIEPCSSNGSIVCSADGKKVFEHIEWIPPQYHTVGQAEFKVKLGPRNDGTDVYTQYWESEILSLPIKFRANYHYQRKKSTVDGMIAYLEFGFDFVVNKPKIFLVTAFDERKLDQVGDAVSKEVGLAWARCPSKDALIDKRIAFSPNNCSTLGSSPDACIVEQSSKSLQVTYTIMVYNYIISKCGFDDLFFIWEEEQGAKETTWECNLPEPNREPNCDELQKKPTIQK